MPLRKQHRRAEGARTAATSAPATGSATPCSAIVHTLRRARPVTVGRSPFVQASADLRMFQELIAKMAREVEKLSFELNVTLPHEIRKAVELGDLKENSEYKAALERQQFVQARLGQLTQRVTKLANIDVAQIAVDRVGLGSQVVVEDAELNIRETYELVFGDAGELQEGHVTMASPIGLALQGKAVGEQVIFKLPKKIRRLVIVELITIHDRAADELA